MSNLSILILISEQAMQYDLIFNLAWYTYFFRCADGD